LLRRPQFTALHFKGTKQRADYIYDIARFYDNTGIIAVPLPAFKWKNGWYRHPKKEVVPCWSTMEIRTGSSNNHQEEGGWNAHNVYTSFWAVPPLPRTSDDYVLKLGSVIDFVSNRTWQAEYIEQAKIEYLPQKWIPDKVDPETIDPKTNIKDTFDPFASNPPTDDDQLVCVDATYFMGESVPPPPYPQGLPLDTWRTVAWREVGQHLHFNREIEELVDEYLTRLFGVDTLDRVPPFITVHMFVLPPIRLLPRSLSQSVYSPHSRRKDFKDFKGYTFTPIEHYQEAIAEARIKLQALLDAPDDMDTNGKPRLQRYSVPPSEYKVLVTTDERPESPFRQQMRKTDWVVIEHVRFLARPHFESMNDRLIALAFVPVATRDRGTVRRMVSRDARRRAAQSRTRLRRHDMVDVFPPRGNAS
jgi:hypothetical protein